MIPHIIHQTGKSTTPEELRFAARLRRMLPGWEYRFWSDEANARMVDEHFPQYAASFHAIRRGVIKADIARVMYMAAFGGFYFDTDYKLLQTLPENFLRQRCVLPISRDEDGIFRVCNSVFGSEAGYPLWHDFLDNLFCNRDLSTLPEDQIEKVTGPEGLTDFYLAHKDRYPDLLLPVRPIFHPPVVMYGFTYQGSPETLGVHYCWGSWRSKDVLGNVKRILARKLTSL